MTADPITIRDLASLEDYQACVDLQNETWGQGFAECVPGAILRVSQKIGGVTAGAFAHDGTLLGFVFGMTGIKDGALVHWSDMLAVRPEARGSGLGVRLKHYQRDAIRRLGVRVMFWTADPLVARNAYLNIEELGARPAEYVDNMYGANTGSTLHGAMPTDRFVYEWRDPDANTDRAPVPDVSAAVPAIHCDPAGHPSAVDPGVAACVSVAIPPDLTAVQAASPDLALAWRLAVRSAMQSLFQRGFHVAAFVRPQASQPPCYLFVRRTDR